MVGKKENGVYLGENEHLYLSDGAHFDIKGLPFDALGSKHVELYIENINSRRENFSKRNLRYLHVIFPDKHSIIPVEFAQLKMSYTQLYCQINKDSLNLPTFSLLKDFQDIGECLYMKSDSHLNGLGNIFATIRIVEKLLGENLSDDFDYLKSLLTIERSHVGDLGLRFNPPIQSIEKFLHPKWNYFHVHNGLEGGNNGICDILISNSLKKNGRLLIFGDSFFRHILHHLSYFFEEILFLRTPFIHYEVVDLYKPDFVLSGQVERYLSDALSDKNAPNFLLYPHLKGLQYNPSLDFITALDCLLSYGRPKYFEFIKSKL